MTKSLHFLLLLTMHFAAQGQQNSHNLIIGTYTNPCKNDGVYVYSFNSVTADFEFKASTKNIINPSFLAVSPDGKFVYTVNEDGDNSKVSAFRFDKNSGNLVFVNSQKSEGNDPCHIINDGQNVIVSNYSGGSVVLFRKNEDGSLQQNEMLEQFSGSSINKERQEKPHVHQAVFSPDKKYVLVVDLGTDAIYTYKYDAGHESAALEAYKVTKVTPGSGPRHLVFSADGSYVYCLHELDGSLTVYGFNNGELKIIEEIAMYRPRGSKEEISAAEIVISPDGNYLYTTNRGTFNNITCYKIRGNGRLEFVDVKPTLGKGPRSFAIDPSGDFLLVAHQYTNNIVVFKIDHKTGKLTDTGKRLELCSPVCLVFE